MRRRKYVCTKKCAYENLNDEIMRYEIMRDENMRNEKTRDENLHTKKSTTKKCWTKKQPVTFNNLYKTAISGQNPMLKVVNFL